jgi:hypothetical protein
MKVIVSDRHLNQHPNFILNMVVLGVKTSFARSSDVVNKGFASNFLEDSSWKMFLFRSRRLKRRQILEKQVVRV